MRAFAIATALFIAQPAVAQKTGTMQQGKFDFGLAHLERAPSRLKKLERSGCKS